MRNNIASLFLALIAAIGCKSIQNVRIRPTTPASRTAAEGERLRAEGLALYNEQPRTLVRVTKAAVALEQAARALRNDYDVQWQAAQTLAFLAEHDERPKFKREAAEHGIVVARRGRELKSDGVEAHYWYAINVGLLADVHRSYGLSAVGEMKAALDRAIEIDERYDYAGPLRVLGILYLRTPAPPVSIGSPRKGLRLLQRAVAVFPDYPENYLYLAEALRDNRRPDEAREALQKVLNAGPWPDRQLESIEWKANAERLRKKL
jgi:tetratricopeptide (TPR) repeat protein